MIILKILFFGLNVWAIMAGILFAISEIVDFSLIITAKRDQILKGEESLKLSRAILAIKGIEMNTRGLKALDSHAYFKSKRLALADPFLDDVDFRVDESLTFLKTKDTAEAIFCGDRKNKRPFYFMRSYVLLGPDLIDPKSPSNKHLESVVAHELGHILLKSVKEQEVDNFAASLVGRDRIVELLYFYRKNLESPVWRESLQGGLSDFIDFQAMVKEIDQRIEVLNSFN